MKATILIIGFGDVGRRLSCIIPPTYRLCALVRSSQAAAEARRFGVQAIRGDLAKPHTLSSLARGAAIVFHFAPPPSRGRLDTHTRNMVKALPRNVTSGATNGRGAMLPQRLIYISTTGVYGDCGGDWIDETAPLKPATARARRRCDAEAVLRKWARRHGVKLSILRAPGIYAADRLPIARIAAGTPALSEADDVYTNHIHAGDLACAAWQAARIGKGRIYNIVDDSALRMGEYFDAVARAAGLPLPPRISRAEAATRLSPSLLSFMSESRRIRNQRMKRELRLQLRYPSVTAFLAEEPPAAASFRAGTRRR